MSNLNEEMRSNILDYANRIKTSSDFNAGAI